VRKPQRRLAQPGGNIARDPQFCYLWQGDPQLFRSILIECWKVLLWKVVSSCPIHSSIHGHVEYPTSVGIWSYHSLLGLKYVQNISVKKTGQFVWSEKYSKSLTGFFCSVCLSRQARGFQTCYMYRRTRKSFNACIADEAQRPDSHLCRRNPPKQYVGAPRTVCWPAQYL
jgi:hypothetical protein